MDNVSRDGNSNKEPKINARDKQTKPNKNTGREMKNAFDGIIGRVDTAEERFPGLEGILIDTTNIENYVG